MSSPYLRIRDLVKRFGDFVALDAVDLDVQEGEFVCFLGPSGCGKTTLLRVIAGLDMQSAGRIEQGGRDISLLPPAKRDFGIVFQSYALFPNLTVFRNIAYGLQSRRLPRAQQAGRVRELLELVGLPDETDKYPAQLSGGQQQRVALARALATSPSLLLLDEPLSALDAKVRVRLRQEIRQLQKRLGVTTIMVTHDQEEALAMADRIVVMDQGRIQQVGTPLEIYRQPASPFIADFVGTMNFLPGVKTAHERVRIGALEFADIRLPAELAPGAPITLCIRPEDIVVNDTNAAGANCFEARIDSLEFLGSFYRAHMHSAALGEKRLITDLSVGIVRDLALDTGRTIPLGMPGSRTLVFPGLLS
jgi:iron(III) transport system ATP-binding protein